ncbi:unnamed protein product, partial [Rotaria sp. Silwood1]
MVAASRTTIVLVGLLVIFLILTIVFAALYGVQRNKNSTAVDTTTIPTTGMKYDSVYIYMIYQLLLAQTDTCATSYCIKAANYLLESIDKTVDPCNNFFEFACGTWLKKNRIPDDAESQDTINSLRNQLDNDIVDMLTSPIPDDLKNLQSIINARRFYDTCINETAIELESVNVTLSFVNNELGGWPILQGLSWNEASYNLSRLLIKLREYSHNMIFGFSTLADDKNSSVNFIRVYQSDIALAQRSNYLNETKVTKAYRQFIHDVAVALRNNIGINSTEFHWTLAEQRARENETVRTTIGNLSQIFNTSAIWIYELSSPYIFFI